MTLGLSSAHETLSEVINGIPCLCAAPCDGHLPTSLNFDGLRWQEPPKLRPIESAAAVIAHLTLARCACAPLPPLSSAFVRWREASLRDGASATNWNASSISMSFQFCQHHQWVAYFAVDKPLGARDAEQESRSLSARSTTRQFRCIVCCRSTAFWSAIFLTLETTTARFPCSRAAIQVQRRPSRFNRQSSARRQAIVGIFCILPAKQD